MKYMLIAAGSLVVPVVLGLVAILAASAKVHKAAVGRVHAKSADLPGNEVGLVLGTSKFSGPRKDRNPHFDHRVAAAAHLYRSGKVRHLLLSGDNGTRGYNEPADMRAALLALGVPDNAMTLDAAGFRTLDSVARARRVFSQRRLTVITDDFHVDRALFLSAHEGIDAVAFPSQEVAMRDSAKSRVREYLADVRACLDVYVLRTRPRFLGVPIELRMAGR